MKHLLASLLIAHTAPATTEPAPTASNTLSATPVKPLLEIKKAPACVIESTCAWQNLDPAASTAQQELFGGKWILGATITFHKKTAEDMYITVLEFAWKGTPLTKLNATLFRCDLDKPFVPLEEHVVADGTWSAEKQIMRFICKEKERLHTIHTFGLVLTVPTEIEALVQKGHFDLVPTSLPQPLQTIALNHPLHVEFMAPAPLKEALVS